MSNETPDIDRISAEPSDAEVEAVAEAMLKQSPADTPAWENWVWTRYARAALLAAREVAGR